MVDNSYDGEEGFSTVSLIGTPLGNALAELMNAPDIQPGDAPSYSICKTIFLYHPLGAKIAEKPITKAMTQSREIEVKDAPSERVKDRFIEQWKLDQAEMSIAQCAILSRVYGVAGIVTLIAGSDPAAPLNYWKLPDADLTFNVLDPLNLSGSFATTQNPNSPEFLKYRNMQVAGTKYHRSRLITKTNEQPIFLGWTASAFGYVGRSSYQRALYPLKSYIQTMLTNDMVSKKAGVLVEMIKGPGSVVNRIAQGLAGFKRSLLKMARTGNVISIGHEDKIESLNLQNLDGAMSMARKNILNDIAAGVPMPALLLNDETMGSDFHEGTEDANEVAQWVDGVRKDLTTLFAYMDRIIQHRAWTPSFYETIQQEFSEYKDVPYEVAFYKWRNSFIPTWPEIIKEKESDAIKVEETRLGGMFQAFDKLQPLCDPDSLGQLVDWVVNNVNEMALLFPVPLVLDISKIVAQAQENKDKQDDMQEQAMLGGPEGGGNEELDDKSDDKPDEDKKRITSGTVVPLSRKTNLGAD